MWYGTEPFNEHHKGKPQWRPCYRVLLFGLPWRRIEAGLYEGYDLGTGDVWIVRSGRRGWTAHIEGTEASGDPLPVLPTMREAMAYCEDQARHSAAPERELDDPVRIEWLRRAYPKDYA